MRPCTPFFTVEIFTEPGNPRKRGIVVMDAQRQIVQVTSNNLSPVQAEARIRSVKCAFEAGFRAALELQQQHVYKDLGFDVKVAK